MDTIYIYTHIIIILQLLSCYYTYNMMSKKLSCQEQY